MSSASTESFIRGSFVGVNLLMAVAGAQLCLCTYALIAFLHSSPEFRRAKRWQLMISFFIFAVFVFVSVERRLESAWLLVAKYGGVSEFRAPLWWLVSEPVAVAVIHATGEGVFLFRCYILWRHKKWVMALPTVLCAATISLGVAASIQTTNRDYTVGSKLRFGYFTLSIATNLCMTCLIAAPLIKMRIRMNALRKLLEVRRRPEVLDPDLDLGRRLSVESKEEGSRRSVEEGDFSSTKEYTSIVSILVESALPFSLVGVVCAVRAYMASEPAPPLPSAHGAFLLAAPVTNALWVSACALAPQLIIFRVTIGATWTTNPVGRVSSPICFGAGAGRLGGGASGGCVDD